MCFCLTSRASKKSFVCEILLPAAFICLAMVSSVILPPFKDDPSLELQPWMYEPRLGSPNLYSFFNSANTSDPLSQKLENLILKSPHYGTRCMNPDKHTIPDKPCLRLYNETWTVAIPDVQGSERRTTGCI